MKRTATLLRAKRVGGWVFNRFHNNKLLSKAIMINASQKKQSRLCGTKDMKSEDCILSQELYIIIGKR